MGRAPGIVMPTAGNVGRKGDGAPPRTTLRDLVGAGHRIMALTLPFAAAGIAANALWPAAFQIGLGLPGRLAGGVMLAVGVPIWLSSAVQVLIAVPKGRLVTNGAFALMRHPLYTSVALLVVPGLGIVLDSWLGPALGLVLYVASRLFEDAEDAELAARFKDEYARYRQSVLLPWL